MISQDTSAYGVDVKYRTGFWQGRPLKHADGRARHGARREPGRLGAPALRLSVSARRTRSIPLMARRAEVAAVPRRAVPAREPAHPEAHEAPGDAGENARAHRRPGARPVPTSPCAATFIAGFPGETEARVRGAARVPRGSASSTAWAASRYSPVDGAAALALPDRGPGRNVREERPSALHGRRRQRSAASASRARVGDDARGAQWTRIEGECARSAVRRPRMRRR